MESAPTTDAVIHVLPDTLANKIAAGEVVQRPASVVKELMENAVDAGAERIEVIVQQAGRELIQIVDDGCGMSEEDAVRSFQRHATSKISSVEDLDRIYTLGFRGEALASIAAVAQVEMRTRRRLDAAGTLVRIDGGHVRAVEPVATAEGTSIAVRNLYYNVPARRNFLKSHATEFKHILDTFQFIALAAPSVAFDLTHDGAEAARLAAQPGGGDPLHALRNRIADLLGKRRVEGLVPVRFEGGYLTLEGVVGKPEFSRKTRGEQYFFVNGRYVRDHVLNHAVATAYGEMLPKGAHPFFVLFLKLDPRHVDVNVHPTKAEVKFDDERGIFGAIRTAVKEALGRSDISPRLGFSQADRLSERAYTSQTPRPERGDGGGRKTVPRADQDRLFDAFGDPAQTSTRRDLPSRHVGPRIDGPDPVEALYGGQTRTPGEEGATSGPGLETGATGAIPQPRGPEPIFPQLWQLSEKYVLGRQEEGMMIMDQHAAHERILYEKFLAAFEAEGAPSQQLLFPHTIEFGPADFALLGELIPDLRTLGFEIELFGGRSVIVRGVPVDVPSGHERSSLEEVLQQFKSYRDELQLPVRDNLAKSLACRSAIKTGKRLTQTEMQTLYRHLLACDMPYACPHGRPTIVRITLDELDKRFGRIGHLERE